MLADARTILAGHEVDTAPLDDLSQVTQILGYYGIDAGRISLDLGLTRGLQYYTGLIFEIHHRDGDDDERQICGGGRYDDLIYTLGGSQNIPATGFSYGLERVCHALELEGKLPEVGLLQPDALVMPVDQADWACAIQTAEYLREQGLKVEIDVTEKGVKSGLRYADKEDIPVAIIVGARERETGEMILRHMPSRQEYCVSLDQVVDKIKELSQKHVR